MDNSGEGAFDRVADLGRDIGEYIKQQRNLAKISLRQLSRLAGVSNPYLSQIERGLRKPSAEILQQIAKGLRISAEALYVQAGILDLPTGGPVTDAVRADEHLTERQKQVLLDIYESFRRENSAAKSTPDATASTVEPEPRSERE
ncbi:helix-turn-helix domain-containing protein [Actinokineospora enzanensis]|uniref:helix-turn-helix domain-containing protein n=1 Tax=Actinokineospora enzanensis TaxID=155975 RepID=UPI000379ED54|nr:helix-turn-helix transcriptional regulator [Actinokineospora enzanensis]